MSIGSNIKSARTKKGLTQKQLGQKLGVSQSAIGQFEKDSSSPNIKTIEKIADALDINYRELVEPDDIFTVIQSSLPDALDKAVESLKAVGINDYEVANLINLYQNVLNGEGKKEALKRVEELAEIKKYRKDKENNTG